MIASPLLLAINFAFTIIFDISLLLFGIFFVIYWALYQIYLNGDQSITNFEHKKQVNVEIVTNGEDEVLVDISFPDTSELFTLEENEKL